MESPFLHHASFCGNGRGGMNINSNNRGNFDPRGRRGFGPPRGASNFVQPPMVPHFHQQWSGTDMRPQRPHQGFGPGPDGPGSYGNQGGRPQPNMIWSDPSLFQPRPFGRGSYQGGPPRMPVSYGGETPKGSASDGCGYGRGGFVRGRGRGNRHHSQQDKSGGMQNRQQNNFQSQKKKADKRDLPENNKFHCEVCDRGFKNEVEYDNHNAQHQQCSVKGCRYVAVPKLLQLHYQTQHRTGVAKEIWSIESPEEIEKWKQERRKNFPTKENILKKRQLESEKRERGEVVETKQFGKFRNQGNRRGRGHQRNRGHQDRRGFPHQAGFRDRTADVALGKPDDVAGVSHKTHLSPEENARVASETTSSPQSKKQQVSGVTDAADEPVGMGSDPLSLLIDGKSDNETDDSDVPVETSVRPDQMGKSGLANLMSSYQSDDEENSKNTADVAAAAGKGAVQVVNTKEELTEITEVATPSTKPATTRQTCKRSHSAASLNKGKQLNKKKKTFHKATLLEKLLKNDIRHERNVILQCVYFIVKNRFLDVCNGN